jgi:transcriptional regulator with XRE-family HTH domain
MGANDSDISMDKARERFEQSGLSLDDLGLRMGYPKEYARKSAWQFLNKTNDPRVSTLRKFAEAVGCSVKPLF